ncbi:hypothetical protein WJX84_009961 [Apatococcus fuscideae]|uniref:von Hippel-Lindau disease tumour suppressor beta domain-containing protein n=1 Tax=Apatococcus fuscideae TaxID=2026836 RepID=A0AAW1STE1_9CHLO
MRQRPARSTPSPIHCQVRFVNNSSCALEAVWLDYQGGEITYATIEPCTQHIQDTYVTHPWILRRVDNREVAGCYCGPDATVEVNQHNFCVAQPEVHCPIWPGSHMWPAHWGNYGMRGKASGIQIMAFNCVADGAVEIAAHLLNQLLACCNDGMLQRLQKAHAAFAIIGRQQVTTDIPPHSHLRGLKCSTLDRTYDSGTRGLGGSSTNPTASCGEENLTMQDDRHYSQENILIHEFGHSVMCIGMTDQQRQAVQSAYSSAKQQSLYHPSCYSMENADEYWAELTQSWFEATVRTDVNSGINTRQKVKQHDASIAALLQQMYGDSPWRYWHDCPVSFPSPAQQESPPARAAILAQNRNFAAPSPGLESALNFAMSLHTLYDDSTDCELISASNSWVSTK